MAYIYKTTKQFDKDVKHCQKRGLPMEKLVTVVRLLVENGKLPTKYRPINCQVIIKVFGSVIFNRIGCYFGNKMMKS